jgi:hypothetical protein
MKERPILFSAPMIRALLDGSKTQTRRIVKPDPGQYWNPVVGLYNPVEIENGGYEAPGPEIFGASDETHGRKCPYGKPGDQLWVRETHSFVPDHDEPAGYSGLLFKADGDAPCGKWYPSIHMYRIDSRIQLEVVSIRVERLQDINYEDARAEGVSPFVWAGILINGYKALWESINGAGSWNANPWVWVVEFKRVAP